MLRLPDPDRRHRRVRVYQELSRPRDSLTATWRDGVWTATLPRPDRTTPPRALRVEYAFVVDHADGGWSFLPDASNPCSADGPFGVKSVVELPGYRQPEWLARTAEDAAPNVVWDRIRLPRFDADLEVGLWQPHGIAAAATLPLLLVNDGPEYAQYAGLLHFLDLAVRERRVPPLRVALLAPLAGRRDETYSAAARYADAIAFTAFPWLRTRAPWLDGTPPVAMGASLGALAALHLAHRHPGRLSGLFLQSGSYFRQRTDPQERGFAHFDRIARFVGTVLSARRVARPLRIVMTCGLVEENLANNERMADALAAAGHDVTFTRHPDAHTYTAWRDALDPALVELLRDVWPREE